MKPFFDVSIAGVFGIAQKLMSRNVSMTFTDSTGFENAKVNFVLEDDPPNIVPPKETPMGVVLGYNFQTGADFRYNGITQFCGTFYRDEAKFAKPPALLTLTAHSNYTGNKFKEIKDRDFHNKKLGEIVEQIASDNEVSTRIADELKDKAIEHVDQANVSDMAFLTDLARRHDAVFKIAEGMLYFGKKGSLKALSGQILLPIFVHENECASYNGLIQERSVFTGVKARYTSLSTAEELFELAGEEGNTKTLPHRLPTQQEAKDAAEAEFNELEKEAETLSFTCVGNPRIVSESPIILVGFRPGLRTVWRADKVTHKLTPSSYITTVECKLPDRATRKETVTGRDN